MTERDLYPGILAGAKADNILLCRIADGQNTGKKPFDIFGIGWGGIAIAIEVKVSKGVSLTGERAMKLLLPHQQNWIRAYGICGGLSIVAVYSEITHRIYIFGHDEEYKFMLYKENKIWRGWPAAISIAKKSSYHKDYNVLSIV